jgi:hypothetical protein
MPSVPTTVLILKVTNPDFKYLNELLDKISKISPEKGSALKDTIPLMPIF